MIKINKTKKEVKRESITQFGFGGKKSTRRK